VRAAFTIRDLLIAVAVIGVLLGLLMPFLMQAREAARQNGCTGFNMQLGIAVNNYVAFHKTFPSLGDDNMLTAVAGSTTPDVSRSSYSWFVAVLPYLSEGTLYNSIETTSKDFRIPPTSPAVQDSKGQQFLRHPLYILRCPSYAGAQTSDVSVSGAQVTTYHALTATRLVFMAMPTRADGLIIPGGGVRERDVTDGISRTIMLCESKEPRFAVWGEAVTNWVVALDPAQTASNRELDWAETRNSMRLGAQKYDAPCVPARLWGAGGDRWWGPSSDHRGGVVIHSFGDAGTRALTPDVDAKAYASIVTRSGADEP
jgi:hypothetical protein